MVWLWTARLVAVTVPGDHDLPVSSAFLPGGYRGTCPICGGPAQQAERYPRALCLPCTDLAVCQEHSLPARLGGEGSIGGGFRPGHLTADGRWHPCTGDGAVLVGARRCIMQEARFGGTVVQPAS